MSTRISLDCPAIVLGLQSMSEAEIMKTGSIGEQTTENDSATIGAMTVTASSGDRKMVFNLPRRRSSSP